MVIGACSLETRPLIEPGYTPDGSEASGPSECGEGRCSDASAAFDASEPASGGADAAADCDGSCRGAVDAGDADAESDGAEPALEEVLRGAGAPCDDSAQCESGYCNNGLCCAGGTCCATVADCSALDDEAPVCTQRESCQGTRRAPRCEESRCVAGADTVADDRACDARVVADECGPYVALRCTGERDQEVPSCPTSCRENSECDPEAHCDGALCKADEPDGSPCVTDADCQSGHCSGGVCCAGGDCCANAGDCPASYRSESWCDDRAGCQGRRFDAICTEFICHRVPVADDSGCRGAMPALQCALMPDRYCDGSVEQTEPSCVCGEDGDCDAYAFCEQSQCQLDREDGQACERAAQCQSGHCQNGYCCSSGDCCATASDCPVPEYGSPILCEDALDCGERRVPVCNEAFQCESGVVDD